MIQLIRDDRGLASAELLFVTVVVLIIIGSTLSLVNNQINVANSGEWGQARVLGEKLAEAINTVYTNGNGYSILFNIPPISDGYPAVTANVTNTSVITMYLGGTSSKNIKINIIPKNVVNTIMTNSHTYNISNMNGTINITQVS